MKQRTYKHTDETYSVKPKTVKSYSRMSPIAEENLLTYANSVYAKNRFLLLCEKHIMNTKLSHVLDKVRYKKGDCDVCFIGEQHYYINNRCLGIFDMFVNLYQDILTNPVNPELDLFIEAPYDELYSSYPDLPPITLSNLYQVKRLIESGFAHEPFEQIIYVRHLFRGCMLNHDCPIRVHWADCNLHFKDTSWMYPLAQMGIHGIGPNLAPHFKFPELAPLTPHLVTPAMTEALQGDSEADRYRVILAMLNHPILKKEIRKVQRIYSKFTMKWFEHLFIDLLKSNEFYDTPLNQMTRHGLRIIMDLYIIARMFKLKMKNVIIYAGAAHTRQLSRILESLEFVEIKRSDIDDNCNDPKRLY